MTDTALARTETSTDFLKSTAAWVTDELLAAGLEKLSDIELLLAEAHVAGGSAEESAALAKAATTRFVTTAIRPFVRTAFEHIYNQLEGAPALVKGAGRTQIHLNIDPVCAAWVDCLNKVLARVGHLPPSPPADVRAHDPELVKQLTLGIHEILDAAERRLNKSDAPSVVTVERQAGMTANDMATIVRAIRESPVNVNVQVDHRTPAREALIMRDDNGEVIGVRTVPLNVEADLQAEDAHEQAFNVPTAQDDANETGRAVSDLRGVPFAPVPTAPGRSSRRGVTPGKAARMRELAKSADPEIRNDARAWLRKRHIPEEQQ